MSCDYCKLCGLVNKVCVSSRVVQDYKKTRLLIVGSSPTAMEDNYGVAQINQDAILTDQQLSVAGIDHKECRWTYAVRCFTYENAASKNSKGSMFKKERPPTPEEFAACSIHLFDEIQESDPEIIVTLGATTFDLLMSNIKPCKIMSIRGNAHHINVRGKEYVVYPTINPVAVRSNQGLMSIFARDIATVGRMLNNKYGSNMPVSNFINNTDDAIKFLIDFESRVNDGEFVFDIESAGDYSSFDPYGIGARLLGIGFACDRKNGYYISLNHKDSGVDVGVIKPYIHKLFKKRGMAHNAKFDIKWINEHLGVKPNISYDTMIMSHSLWGDTRPNHDLKNLAQDLLGYEDWESELHTHLSSKPNFICMKCGNGSNTNSKVCKSCSSSGSNRKRNYGDADNEILGKYACIDVCATFGVYEELLKKHNELKVAKLDAVMDLNARATDVFSEIEINGCTLDPEYVQKLKDDYPPRLEEVNASLLKDPVVAAYSSFRKLEDEDCVLSLGTNPFHARHCTHLMEQSEFIAFKQKILLKYNKNKSDKVGMAYRLHYYLAERGILSNPGLDYPTDSQLYTDWLTANYNAMLDLLPVFVGYNIKPIEFSKDTGLPSCGEEQIITYAKEYECKECSGYRTSDDGEVCLACNGTGAIKGGEVHFEYLDNLRLAKKLSKLITTYINGFDDYIRPNKNILNVTYKLQGTRTGRASTTEMSIHGFPAKSDIKRVFVSKYKDIGGLILSADFSQLELRVFAAVTGDPDMINAYVNDEDLHRMVAAGIYKKAIEDVTDGERKFGKQMGFGVIFGKSAETMAEDTGLTVAEAKANIDAYYKRFPKTLEWISSQHEFVKKHGYVITKFGRIRYLPDALLKPTSRDNKMRISDAERRSVNTPIQSDASWIVFETIIYTQMQYRQNNMKSRIWCTVHDSVSIDVYPGELYQCVSILRYAMEEYLVKTFDWLKVPMKGDIEIGNRWGGSLECELHPEYTDGSRLKLIDDNTVEMYLSGKQNLFDDMLLTLNNGYDVKYEITKTKEEKRGTRLIAKQGLGATNDSKNKITVKLTMSNKKLQ